MDINPQNIVLEKNFDPKIIDFNSSVILEPICGSEIKSNLKIAKNKKKNDLIYNKKGTIMYCPPESFSKNKIFGFSGKKSDGWALGLLLYNLIFGSHPFQINENILIDKNFWKKAKIKITQDLKGKIKHQNNKRKDKISNNQKDISKKGTENNTNINYNIEYKKETKKEKNNIFGAFLNFFERNKIKKDERNFFLKKNINIIHDLLHLDPNKRKDLKILVTENICVLKDQKTENSWRIKLLKKYFNELKSNVGCVGNEGKEESF